MEKRSYRKERLTSTQWLHQSTLLYSFFPHGLDYPTVHSRKGQEVYKVYEETRNRSWSEREIKGKERGSSLHSQLVTRLESVCVLIYSTSFVCRSDWLFGRLPSDRGMKRRGEMPIPLNPLFHPVVTHTCLVERGLEKEYLAPTERSYRRISGYPFSLSLSSPAHWEHSGWSSNRISQQRGDRTHCEDKSI